MKELQHPPLCSRCFRDLLPQDVLDEQVPQGRWRPVPGRREEVVVQVHVDALPDAREGDVPVADVLDGPRPERAKRENRANSFLPINLQTGGVSLDPIKA